MLRAFLAGWLITVGFCFTLLTFINGAFFFPAAMCFLALWVLSAVGE